MSQLDPRKIFNRLKQEIPQPYRDQIIVVGSLAAGYHFRVQLPGRAVNTKDADLLVTSAVSASACRAMTERLLGLGFTHKWSEGRKPGVGATPSKDLPFIRLEPADTPDYFVEFLGLPDPDQKERRSILRVELADGIYGIPRHRFLRLAVEGALISSEGIRYASPRMMALANLLSHRILGRRPDRKMSGPVGNVDYGLDPRDIWRSAKDLGRALAILYLSKRDEEVQWVDPWDEAIKKCFPRTHRHLRRQVGIGLGSLVKNRLIFDQALWSVQCGLLAGQAVRLRDLEVLAKRLIQNVAEPLRARAAKS